TKTSRSGSVPARPPQRAAFHGAVRRPIAAMPTAAPSVTWVRESMGAALAPRAARQQPGEGARQGEQEPEDQEAHGVGGLAAPGQIDPGKRELLGIDHGEEHAFGHDRDEERGPEDLHQESTRAAPGRRLHSGPPGRAAIRQVGAPASTGAASRQSPASAASWTVHLPDRGSVSPPAT